MKTEKTSKQTQPTPVRLPELGTPAHQIASLVSSSAETLCYVEAMRLRYNHPAILAQKYERWLEAEIEKILTAPENAHDERGV